MCECMYVCMDQVRQKVVYRDVREHVQCIQVILRKLATYLQNMTCHLFLSSTHYGG